MQISGAVLRHFHCLYIWRSCLIQPPSLCVETTSLITMQTARLGLCTVSRSIPRAFSSLRAVRASPFLLKQQSRFASYKYQRFGGQGGQGGQRGDEKPYSNFRPVYRVQYIWRNYRPAIVVVGSGGAVVYVYNLEQVPLTKRRRFNVISPETEKAFGDSQYQEILNEFKGRILPANHPYTELVARVTERLLPHSGLADEEWKVHVIDDSTNANAFVIPGGKVFVFTGILPLCQDEDGLASVLGHEIAHNVAHHMAERLSGSVFIGLASILGSLLFDVSGQLSGQFANLILSLPNSRTQEREADHIGLLIMAESCYDPSSALDFWSRMEEAEKGAPPQFMSTHPSNYNRRELIKSWLPQAMDKFEQGGCTIASRHNQSFKDAFQKQGQTSRAPQQVLVGGGGDGDDFF